VTSSILLIEPVLEITEIPSGLKHSNSRAQKQKKRQENKGKPNEGDTYGKLSRSAPGARSPTFSRGGLDETRSPSVSTLMVGMKGVFGCSLRPN